MDIKTNDAGNVMNRATTNIGFIGAGKVGVTLGAYLRAGGHAMTGYLSRSIGSAREAARITSTRCFTDIEELVRASGIIFITTPDDEIERVWNSLARCAISGRIICHTSGSLSSTVFRGAQERSAYAYSVHPMHAFTQRDGNTAGLENAYFTVEGDGEKLEEVCGLFSKTGNKTLRIGHGEKTLYHLANVTVSNLVLALLSLGIECFERCGIPAEAAMEAAAPLIFGNIGNIMQKGFMQALTGPVERDDTGTVLKHEKVLPKGLKGVYPLLSMRLLELAQGKHPDRDYGELRNFLAGSGRNTSKEVENE